jgi:hypothetical protein
VVIEIPVEREVATDGKVVVYCTRESEIQKSLPRMDGFANHERCKPLPHGTYQKIGETYIFGEPFHLEGGLESEAIYCSYTKRQTVDEIYDLEVWMSYKEDRLSKTFPKQKVLKRMRDCGYDMFKDFHIQAIYSMKCFDHPDHLVNTFIKFHEDQEFYNSLMRFPA